MQLLVQKLWLKFSQILTSDEQYSADPWRIATIVLFGHKRAILLIYKDGRPRSRNGALRIGQTRQLARWQNS